MAEPVSVPLATHRVVAALEGMRALVVRGPLPALRALDRAAVAAAQLAATSAEGAAAALVFWAKVQTAWGLLLH